MSYPKDQDFQEVAVKSVTKESGGGGGGWMVEREDGWSFFVPPTSPLEPHAGSVLRFYGKGIGYVVRGLFVDGEQVFYRSEEEQARHADEERYGRDPSDLLARWDAGKSVWSVARGGFGPGYEQALQIAMFEVLRFLIADKPDETEWESGEAYRAYFDGVVDKQVLPVVEPLGLSGAQWGAAASLAARIYRDGPQATMRLAPQDAAIQVSRHFPTLHVPVKVAA